MATFEIAILQINHFRFAHFPVAEVGLIRDFTGNHKTRYKFSAVSAIVQLKQTLNIWNMKTPRIVAASLTFAASVATSLPCFAAVTGQWDFNSGNLSATIGTDLTYRGDTELFTAFTTTTIGGQPANIMQFPAATATQGYVMTHGIAPNGGGGWVNQYTLIMDIMFPSASSGVWRGLFQTSQGNVNDGDLFVNPSNGIGISSVYHGTLQPDTWHRVAFVVDLTLATDRLRKFIDGTLVGSQDLSSGVDGRWSLDPTALLFTDEDNETAMGYVNSLQIHDMVMADSFIASPGVATAAGIPVIPEPASALLLGAGVFLLVLNRRRTNG